MKRISYYTLYIIHFSSRYKKNLSLGGLALLILIFFMIHVKLRVNEPVITEAVVGSFTEKDLPIFITSLLSDSLMVMDQQGSPSAKLVSSIQTSEDAKLYTLKLKDNLFWEDGTKVTAGDIDLKFKDVSVSATDEQTLQFTLGDSFSPFPSLLTRPIFKYNFIGTGPYYIHSIIKDDAIIKKMTLKSKNTDLPTMIVRFYPNEKTAKDALRLGEVQAIMGLSELEDFSDQKPFTSISIPNYTRLVAIFYNTQDPVLSDENLRMALSYAAPTIPGEIEAKTPIPPYSWGFNSQVRDFLDNSEMASQFLKKSKPLEEPINLTVTSSLQSIGEQVVSAWQKHGIKVNLRMESGIPQNFQALLIAQKIPIDPDQYALWHKLGPNNITKFSYERLDKDLEDGRKIVDYELRKQKYEDFQKVLLDKSPATFLYYQKFNVVYMKKIEGLLQKVLQMQLESLP